MDKPLSFSPLGALGAIFLVVSLSATLDAQPTAEQYFSKGRALHIGQGGEPDLATALRYYAQALKSKSDFVPALYNSALIYFQMGEVGKAQTYFSKTIKAARAQGLTEQEAMASSGLGSCLQKAEQLDKAETWFKSAIRKNPGLVEAHFNLANLLLQQNRRKEARAVLVRAAEQAPSDRYQLIVGRLEAKEGQDAWKPLWVKVSGVGLVGGLLLYGLYRKLRKAA